MKKIKFLERTSLLVSAFVAGVLLTGCATSKTEQTAVDASANQIPNTDHIVRLSKDQRITQPLPDKVLVNFHRVSWYSPTHRYAIFNGEGLFICDLPASAGFQYVCDPGQQVFIGWAFGVSVVQADLAPGKVYDIMVDPGWGGMIAGAQIRLHPLTRNDRRRANLAEYEEREDLVSQIRTRHVVDFENRERAHVEDIKRDFLGGKKTRQVQHLGTEDCR
ncbi:MAG: hypothetical protein ABSH11_08925 [Verrucomicrobiota bacterium]|jgi:hypothetical protein